MIALLLFPLRGTAALPDVSQCRKLLQAAYEDQEASAHFYQRTRVVTEQSPALLLGFKAMAALLRCSHVPRPLAKLSFFNNGKRLLELAIEREPENAELRYFRFSTQSKVPAWLNYKQCLKKDKAFLLAYLKTPKQDEYLSGCIKAILLQSNYCSEQEKASVKSL